MREEQKQTSTSPFDCVVCGAYVYGNNSGIRICLPSSLPPCRACRLQKCLSVGIDFNLLRPRSESSPPSILVDKFFNNILVKTSSFDDTTVPSTKRTSSNTDTKIDNDEMIFGRTRCSSDATDRPNTFFHEDH
ncbi:unnamed protein product [Rotaria sp. Silwood2]|nr:unnamed protein product [Rotaria sp. Silwood2]CAF3216776.1 unnamed protein product [Rotaria sp. Silwood2]CAF3276813.1 unnamed protein product [Rotaria sp. Silwood2]CAF4277474.1 unnamed protein product [Rotaria sp. Silwood2]CAF4651561.1 unnamed protein product [Rotaria sp. Silwood2]